MGNGRNIRVLEDNWVPNSSTHKVICPKGMFPLDSKVCDFIDVEKRCWDSDLLNQAFLPFEVEEIARIPLSVRLPKDKQVWVETSNDFFIVRSAYRVALELEANKEMGSCSDESNLHQFWKRLWSIQIAHKIRHFAWYEGRYWLAIM